VWLVIGLFGTHRDGMRHGLFEVVDLEVEVRGRGNPEEIRPTQSVACAP